MILTHSWRNKVQRPIYYFQEMPMKKDLPIMDFAVAVVVVLGYDVQYYYPKCGTNYSTVQYIGLAE